jgi:hypothetical protein
LSVLERHLLSPHTFCTYARVLSQQMLAPHLRRKRVADVAAKAAALRAKAKAKSTASSTGGAGKTAAKKTTVLVSVQAASAHNPHTATDRCQLCTSTNSPLIIVVTKCTRAHARIPPPPPHTHTLTHPHSLTHSHSLTHTPTNCADAATTGKQ